MSLSSDDPAGKAGPIEVRADQADTPLVGPFRYPNQVLDAAACHPGLRSAPLALRLLAVLANYAATSGCCWPSIHLLAERLRSWRDAIRRAMRLLARFGFLAYSIPPGSTTYLFILPLITRSHGEGGGARQPAPGGRAGGAEGGAPARPELIRTDPEELNQTTGSDESPTPAPAPDPVGCPPCPTVSDPSDAWCSYPLEVAEKAGPRHPATARAVGKASEVLARRLASQETAVVAGRIWGAIRDPQKARRLRRASVHATLGEKYGLPPAELGRAFGAICSGHDLPLPVAPDSEAARARARELSGELGRARPGPGGGGPQLLGSFLERVMDSTRTAELPCGASAG